MFVTAWREGRMCRVGLWTLGRGKPKLHVGNERIDVETVGDVRRELEARGFTRVVVCGWTGEFEE